MTDTTLVQRLDGLRLHAFKTGSTNDRMAYLIALSSVFQAGELVAADDKKAADEIDRLTAELAEKERQIARLTNAVEFTARWAWRTDPPNANNQLTDSERLGVIKFHPTIKNFGKPHIELAERETQSFLASKGE